MKLLLDEMFSSSIARGLRDGRGVDIVAIAERNDLRGLPDLDVFLAAQHEQRAIVTENVRDFRLIAREWEGRGRVHFGLVLTTNRRYPRADPRTSGRLRRALSDLTLTESGAPTASNREFWL